MCKSYGSFADEPVVFLKIEEGELDHYLEKLPLIKDSNVKFDLYDLKNKEPIVQVERIELEKFKIWILLKSTVIKNIANKNLTVKQVPLYFNIEDGTEHVNFKNNIILDLILEKKFNVVNSVKIVDGAVVGSDQSLFKVVESKKDIVLLIKNLSAISNMEFCVIKE